MTLEQAIEHAAEHLPENWRVMITVENGAGWVDAERPDGTLVPMHADETDFAEQVSAAVALAHDEREAEEMSEELDAVPFPTSEEAQQILAEEGITTTDLPARCMEMLCGIMGHKWKQTWPLDPREYKCTRCGIVQMA